MYRYYLFPNLILTLTLTLMSFIDYLLFHPMCSMLCSLSMTWNVLWSCKITKNTSSSCISSIIPWQLREDRVLYICAVWPHRRKDIIASFCLIEPIIIQCWQLIEDIREVRQAVYIFFRYKAVWIMILGKHMSMEDILMAKSMEVNRSVNQKHIGWLCTFLLLRLCINC